MRDHLKVVAAGLHSEARSTIIVSPVSPSPMKFWVTSISSWAFNTTWRGDEAGTRHVFGCEKDLPGTLGNRGGVRRWPPPTDAPPTARGTENRVVLSYLPELRPRSRYALACRSRSLSVSALAVTSTRAS